MLAIDDVGECIIKVSIECEADRFDCNVFVVQMRWHEILTNGKLCWDVVHWETAFFVSLFLMPSTENIFLLFVLSVLLKLLKYLITNIEGKRKMLF